MSLKRIELQQERIYSLDTYPFNIPSIRHLEQLNIESPVTLQGENGSGKSTLLEAIADKCDFNTAGGGRNNFYEVHASQAALGEYIRLSWLPKLTNGFFLRAESFYHFLPRILIGQEQMHLADNLCMHNHMGNPFSSFFEQVYQKRNISARRTGGRTFASKTACIFKTDA